MCQRGSCRDRPQCEDICLAGYVALPRLHPAICQGRFAPVLPLAAAGLLAFAMKRVWAIGGLLLVVVGRFAMSVPTAILGRVRSFEAG